MTKVLSEKQMNRLKPIKSNAILDLEKAKKYHNTIFIIHIDIKPPFCQLFSVSF